MTCCFAAIAVYIRLGHYVTDFGNACSLLMGLGGGEGGGGRRETSQQHLEL